MTQLQVFQCPACGANLTYNGSSETTFICEYCHASIRVPEELRPQAAPAPEPQPAAAGPYTPVAPLGGVVITGLGLNIAVVDWLVVQASVQTGKKIADDPQAYQRIARAAETAMLDLKTRDPVVISLPFLTADAYGPKHFETQLTRRVVDGLASNAFNPESQPPAKAKGFFGF